MIPCLKFIIILPNDFSLTRLWAHVSEGKLAVCKPSSSSSSSYHVMSRDLADDQADEEGGRLQQADDKARGEEGQGAAGDDAGPEDGEAAARGAVPGQGVPGADPEGVG